MEATDNPRQLLDLVTEAIERFLDDQQVQGKGKEEWSSHEMATAILDAVPMGLLNTL
ncbi:hypothetical protein LCGC14_2056520 [marine sediment metagenome]|uniref:Uncharacterized protein n=1 Tax=marine sediment metagenome TaxID=412755 RepID=A0A0F9HJH5_9ZZZZ